MSRIPNGDVAIISLCHQMGRRRFTRAKSEFATARAQRNSSHGRRVLRQRETGVRFEKYERERDALRV